MLALAMHVTALAGGVGGAKLLVGLQRVLDPGDLTAVVNTGDDADIYGVRVCPDVDIVTYWLAGIADTEQGFGIAGDSHTVVGTLERLGTSAWFRLGDRDLATCLHRTAQLRAGVPLSRITAGIAAALGVPTRILPMTDDEVRTRLSLGDGRVLDFQDYFVRERHRPRVSEVLLAGIAGARPAPGVIEAVTDADVVVLCPSNPLLSIGPILALPGVRDALRRHPRVVAVSPLVAGRALKGPADRLLADLGYEADAAGVASLYSDLCDVFVLDHADAAQASKVEALGPTALVTATVMTDERASAALAEALLR